MRIRRSARVFGSQIRHQNALTEKAWEDAVQGLYRQANPVRVNLISIFEFYLLLFHQTS